MGTSLLPAPAGMVPRGDVVVTGNAGCFLACAGMFPASTGPVCVWAWGWVGCVLVVWGWAGWGVCGGWVGGVWVVLVWWLCVGGVAGS